MKLKAWLFMVGTTTVAISAPALGQTASGSGQATASAPAPSADQANMSVLDDIIVTAERREGSAQKTPVSVSVLSGNFISQSNITSQAELATAIPGLSLQAGVSSNQINYIVRGQSTDPYSNTRPGVLPYYNEVQIGGDPGAGAFYDLQSVQVLKGPQGTLFGRNSTGGAVLITTAKPGSEVGGFVNISAGNYSTLRAEAAVDLPINSAVRLRIAGFSEQRGDGIQRNILLGTDLGTRDRKGVRGTLAADIGSSLTNDLVVEYLKIDETNVSSVINYANPTYPTSAPAALLASPALDLVTGFPGAYALVLQAHPQYDPNGLTGAVIAQQARGPFNVKTQSPSNYRSKQFVATNKTTLDLGAFGGLSNILGYASNESFGCNDPFGSPFVLISSCRQANYRLFSEELQLVGTTGNLDYTAGGFFSPEKYTSDTLTTVLDLSPIIPASAQRNIFELKNKTLAGYAQGTFHFTPRLAATVGGRYTSEKVTVELLPGDVYRALIDANAVPGLVARQSKTNHNVSWTARLEYKADKILGYAVARRSFRNGGYNGQIAPFPGLGAAGGDGYATERVTDGEVGIKFTGGQDYANLIVNVAAFNTWVDNNQRTAFASDALGNPASISVNVPKATVKGLEAETSVSPTHWLKIGGNFVYLDSKFTNGNTAVLGVPVAFTTYPYAPKWSGGLYTQGDFRVGNGLDLTIRGDGTGQTDFFYSGRGSINPSNKLGGYVLANFRVALASEKGWTLGANVRNAFNRTYLVGGVDAVSLIQIASVVPGEPRTYSVDIRYKY
jgi:iron complex outermembrane receptor protein